VSVNLNPIEIIKNRQVEEQISFLPPVLYKRLLSLPLTGCVPGAQQESEWLGEFIFSTKVEGNASSGAGSNRGIRSGNAWDMLF
jgi:hypothetical protein